MEIIKASCELFDDINGDAILEKLERIGRECYNSTDKIEKGSAKEFLEKILNNGHESVIEHVPITAKFITDRGVTHEIVRHRLCSFTQESTRYIDYVKLGGITVIEPCFFEKGSDEYKIWKTACQNAENYYFDLIERKKDPEEARTVLPTSLKAVLTVTANIREWRHIFELRCSPDSHPQMREVMLPLLNKMYNRIPVLFDDIWEMYFGGAAYRGM